MKLGAYDYITKPLFPDEILVTVKKAIGRCGSLKNRRNRIYVPSGNSADAASNQKRPAKLLIK